MVFAKLSGRRSGQLSEAAGTMQLSVELCIVVASVLTPWLGSLKCLNRLSPNKKRTIHTNVRCD